MEAYPLQWPQGWPRTSVADQSIPRFNKKGRHHGSGGSSWSYAQELSVSDAVSRLIAEIKLFTRTGQPWRIDPNDVIISTNIQTRLDGLPRSGQRAPEDPGVAVYWLEHQGRQKVQRVMAIDQYTTVAGNLAAIAATLEAMRAIERHGGAQILDRAFTGFAALPSPTQPRTWREVLGVNPDVSDMAFVRAAYRALASRHHPDRGGTHEAMVELNAALTKAEQELRA
jgi:hypothetical protein